MTAQGYDGPPVGEIALPVIDRLETLPYWLLYAEWTGHMGDCPQCSFVMNRPEPQMNDLCSAGRVDVTAMQWDIDQQHAVARLN